MCINPEVEVVLSQLNYIMWTKVLAFLHMICYKAPSAQLFVLMLIREAFAVLQLSGQQRVDEFYTSH